MAQSDMFATTFGTDNPMYKQIKAGEDANNAAQASRDNPNAGLLGSMQRRIDSFKPIQPGASYQAKDMSKAVLPQFDTMRQQTSQALSKQNSTNQDALQRRFAAMGNMNSGAYVKAGQIQDQGNQETTANAMNTIGSQEAAERTNLQNMENQKEFQSGETGRQLGMQSQVENYQLPMQGEGQLAGLNQNASDSEFNRRQQRYKAGHSGGLLGGGGFLGTGVGASDASF